MCQQLNVYRRPFGGRVYRRSRLFSGKVRPRLPLNVLAGSANEEKFQTAAVELVRNFSGPAIAELWAN